MLQASICNLLCQVSYSLSTHSPDKTPAYNRRGNKTGFLQQK
jgi:hypothetical protein